VGRTATLSIRGDLGGGLGGDILDSPDIRYRCVIVPLCICSCSCTRSDGEPSLDRVLKSIVCVNDMRGDQ
jgi:hypothetical protein